MIPVMANIEQGRTAGRLGAIRRYPVKSLAGELRDHTLVDLRGLQGDRLWSVRDPDGKLGSGQVQPPVPSDGRAARADRGLRREVPVIGFPDGTWSAATTTPSTPR